MVQQSYREGGMDIYAIRKPQFLYALMLVLSSVPLNHSVASGCSTSEMQQINSAINQIAQASMYGQIDAVIQLSQQLNASLSPACLQSLQGMNTGGYGGYGSYGNYGGSQGGNIYDHGGGAYSTGGVYCGPSGCYGE